MCAMGNRATPLFTFPLDGDLKDRLDKVKTELGIPVSEQLRRGIRLWLERVEGLEGVGAEGAKTGARKPGRKRAATRKRP